MIIVLLKFSHNKAQAAEYMSEHNAWLKQGMNDGVFLLSGTIQPAQGGAIFVQGLSLDETESRVAQDPFVKHQVVTAQFIEITPSQASDKLAFLIANKEGLTSHD